MEYVYVFITGGIICVIGQLLMDSTKLTPAHVLVIFVTSGAVLTGLGIYQPIVDFGQSGATIPLPGFGYSLAKGAIEGAKTEGLLGALKGGVEANAAGVAAAVVFGYIIALIFSPKTKS